MNRHRIAVLYDHNSIYTNTVRDHLESFYLNSKNDVFYLPATNDALCGNKLDDFDVIIVHYSVRLCYDWHISPSYADAISKSDSLKILFIQDEYDETDMAKEWIRRLGISIVFTCVPEEYREMVYPERELPGVKFLDTITGWVPEELASCRALVPMAERKNWINYRGRELSVRYGSLAREKSVIARRMKAECVKRGVAEDIEWSESSRIYGDDWLGFSSRSRATLGTESGSNVFDFDGSIRKSVDNALRKNPNLEYDEIYSKFVEGHDNQIRMNQISPRIFEAIALKTALVLFEGEYSGVILPWEHYIPLRKDFSNVDDVFSHLSDIGFLEAMVDRAWESVIASDKYTYSSFISGVDSCIDRFSYKKREQESVLVIFERLQSGACGSFESRRLPLRGLKSCWHRFAGLFSAVYRKIHRTPLSRE